MEKANKCAGPSAQGRVRSRNPSCLLHPFLIPPVDPGPLPQSGSVLVVCPQHHGVCTQSVLKSKVFMSEQIMKNS